MTVYLLFIYDSTAVSRRVACLLADGNKSVIIVLFYAIITQKQDFSFCFRYPLYLPIICNTQQKRSKKTILQQKTGKLLGKEKPTTVMAVGVGFIRDYPGCIVRY